MNFNKTYFKQVAKELGETIAEYYKNSAENFIIIEGDKVIMWRGTYDPVIFGSIEDALEELGEWETIKNVSVITEKELLDTYCADELKAALKAEGGIMDTTNGHNPKLVAQINDLWDENKEKFKPILQALYERDEDEIFNAECFDWGMLEKGDMAIRLIFEWEVYAYDYLQHIADDGDLETIIKFIR